MSDQDLDKNLIADHDYDGIRELDNPLPNWWLFTFFGTIIFAGLYYLHYTSLKISSTDQLNSQMAVISDQQEESGLNNFKVDEAQLPDLLNDSAALALGKGHFDSKCAVCHGQEGQGLIGPNLTDNFWVHGQGSFAAIVEIVREGSAAKGMPAWKGMIPDKEMLPLAAYVKSLEGTNPSNPRAPEGEKVGQ